MLQARVAMAELSRALDRLDYRGWDPYDALSSPVLRKVVHGRTLRRVALQSLKRSPVNVRPIVRVPKVEHAKATALAVSAYAKLGDVERATELAGRLSRLALRSPSGVGWGYAFDVDMRWGSYGSHDANAVVTSYAAHALLDLDGGVAFSHDIDGACHFALEELSTDVGGESFFVYCRGSRVPIHNANLLVASYVARASEPGSTERAVAARAVAYTVARQRPDGSWPYGEGRSLGWVDGFHTAYVLERLAQWNRLQPDAAVDAALARGTAYFVERLIDPDGAARATSRSRYPIETHAAASAVTTLLALREYDGRASETAMRVLRWALANLRRRDGRYAFRRGRFATNWVPYLRWSDAHMLLALANVIGGEKA